MSSQDDWGYAGVTERQMEKGSKETPYADSGLGTQVAPEARQVQGGKTGSEGCRPGRGLSQLGISRPCHVGVPFWCYQICHFLQEKPETQIS